MRNPLSWKSFSNQQYCSLREHSGQTLWQNCWLGSGCAPAWAPHQTGWLCLELTKLYHISDASTSLCQKRHMSEGGAYPSKGLQLQLGREQEQKHNSYSCDSEQKLDGAGLPSRSVGSSGVRTCCPSLAHWA